MKSNKFFVLKIEGHPCPRNLEKINVSSILAMSVARFHPNSIGSVVLLIPICIPNFRSLAQSVLKIEGHPCPRTFLVSWLSFSQTHPMVHYLGHNNPIYMEKKFFALKKKSVLKGLNKADF